MPPLDDYLLEIPAGKRDVVGEEPVVTAHRELAEEIGMAADRIELLAEFYNSPGFSDEHSYTFLARGLHADRDAARRDRGAVDGDRARAAAVVPSLIHAGEITDAKTIIGLMLARERLANPPSTVT